MLVAVLANHAASKQWTPDFEGSIELLDAADELIERYGLSRYRVLVNAMRNVALCLVGELAAARAAVDAFDELHLRGIDRWTRTTCRARVALAAGDYDAAFAELTSLSDAELEDRETILDRITMRADALAWLGNLDAARARGRPGPGRARGTPRGLLPRLVRAVGHAERSRRRGRRIRFRIARSTRRGTRAWARGPRELVHDRLRTARLGWHRRGVLARNRRRAGSARERVSGRGRDPGRRPVRSLHDALPRDLLPLARGRSHARRRGARRRDRRLEAGAGGRARTGLRRPGDRDEPTRADDTSCVSGPRAPTSTATLRCRCENWKCCACWSTGAAIPRSPKACSSPAARRRRTCRTFSGSSTPRPESKPSRRRCAEVMSSS